MNPGSIGPVATRQVDGDSYRVDLDLEPILPDLLRDFSRTLSEAHLTGSLHYFGGLQPYEPDYAEVLGRLTDALRARGATVVQLHPDAAERLSGELWEAKDEPDTCTWGEGECANYVDGELCPLHNEKAADVSARMRAL